MENYIKKLRVEENGVMVDKQIDYTALANLPAAATTETAGFVKPDGKTITVDADGTIRADSLDQRLQAVESLLAGVGVAEEGEF